MSRVVARYADGALLKGVTFDFFPGKDSFHVMPKHDGGQVAVETPVDVRDLKALYFVRDFDGDPKHAERLDFDSGHSTPGLRLSVTFCDGEVMVGTTTNYRPDRSAFFVKPADPQSNNERAYVSTNAVRQVSFL